MDVTKPYEFIGFGAMNITKPFEFTGFGAMDVPDTPSGTHRSRWRAKPPTYQMVKHVFV